MIMNSALLCMAVAAAAIVRTVTPDFVRGADVSWVTEMESKGTVFKAADGTPRDCFQLMKDYGLTAIRLRVWVDPKDGWNNVADTLAKAKRAAAAGMDLMVDFHYSDTWADPGQQEMPKAWRGHDADALCRDIAAHTKDVLGLLKKNGIAHVLAVSGLHVGLLYSLVIKILDRKDFRTSVVIVFCLAVYVALADFSVSSMRAALMIFLHLAAFFCVFLANTRNMDPLL